jgi:hypothetical protein
VAHHLQTRSPPITSKFWRLDAEKLAATKKEFLGLEQAGIVPRSNSPWAVRSELCWGEDVFPPVPPPPLLYGG